MSYVTSEHSGGASQDVSDKSKSHPAVESTKHTGDMGYSSNAFITGIQRNQRQLGTQQGDFTQKVIRAADGNLSLNSGGLISSATEALTSSVVNTGPGMHTKPNIPEVNRAHISEYIHYEEEAEGIELRGVNAPASDWDSSEPLNLLFRSKNGGAPQGVSDKSTRRQSVFDNDVQAQTCYIPTNIFGEAQFVEAIKAVCEKHRTVFNTKLNKQPALVPPMELIVDRALWESNKNRGPPRQQTETKQTEIKKQVDAMLSQGVVQLSQAEEYSQVHMTPKPHQAVGAEVKWRFCLDFRRLNMVSKGVGNIIPNIPQMLQRVGSGRPKIFGKIDLTSGYHQAPLGSSSRRFTAFTTFMGIFEWL
jgi:hypothetical protein